MNELIGEIGLLPAVKDMSGYENYLAKDEFFGGQPGYKDFDRSVWEYYNCELWK